MVGAIITGLFSLLSSWSEKPSLRVIEEISILQADFQIKNISRKAPVSIDGETVASVGDVVQFYLPISIPKEISRNEFTVSMLTKNCGIRENCHQFCVNVVWPNDEFKRCDFLIYDGDITKLEHAPTLGVWDIIVGNRDDYQVSYVSGADFSEVVAVKPKNEGVNNEVVLAKGLIIGEFKKYPIPISRQIIDERSIKK